MAKQTTAKKAESTETKLDSELVAPAQNDNKPTDFGFLVDRDKPVTEEQDAYEIVGLPSGFYSKQLFKSDRVRLQPLIDALGAERATFPEGVRYFHFEGEKFTVRKDVSGQFNVFKARGPAEEKEKAPKAEKPVRTIAQERQMTLLEKIEELDSEIADLQAQRRELVGQIDVEIERLKAIKLRG